MNNAVFQLPWKVNRREFQCISINPACWPGQPHDLLDSRLMTRENVKVHRLSSRLLLRLLQSRCQGRLRHPHHPELPSYKPNPYPTFVTCVQKHIPDSLLLLLPSVSNFQTPSHPLQSAQKSRCCCHCHHTAGWSSSGSNPKVPQSPCYK